MNTHMDQEGQRQEKQPQFLVGDYVEYFHRGICYPAVIRADLGIHKGVGRKYEITEQVMEPRVPAFIFEVAERSLVRSEPPWWELLDEETGIRLVSEPEPYDLGRVTCYPPEYTDHLTNEQIHAAIDRLLERIRADPRTSITHAGTATLPA